MSIPDNYLRALHRPKTLLNSLEIEKLKAEKSDQTQGWCEVIRPTQPANGPATTYADNDGQPPKKKRVPGLSKPRKKKAMNKTEVAFSLRLIAQKQAGDIIRWDREGITLRWSDGMTYTPDFSVIAPENDSEPSPAVIVVLIEVKGAYIEGDALVKFRAARAYWPEFQFELHQCKKGGWEKVL